MWLNKSVELNTGSSFTVFWSNLNLESLPFFQGGGGRNGGGSRGSSGRRHWYPGTGTVHLNSAGTPKTVHLSSAGIQNLPLFIVPRHYCAPFTTPSTRMRFRLKMHNLWSVLTRKRWWDLTVKKWMRLQNAVIPLWTSENGGFLKQQRKNAPRTVAFVRVLGVAMRTIVENALKCMRSLVISPSFDIFCHHNHLVLLNTFSFEGTTRLHSTGGIHGN